MKTLFFISLAFVYSFFMNVEKNVSCIFS